MYGLGRLGINTKAGRLGATLAAQWFSRQPAWVCGLICFLKSEKVIASATVEGKESFARGMP